MEDNDYNKMLEIVFTSLRNFVFNTIWSEIKSKTHKSINEKALQQKINDVLSNYQERFDNIDLSSEFDLQGLLDYVNSHLMRDIDTYLYGTSSQDRNRAYNNIINKGIRYSSAQSLEARSNVRNLLNDLLEIIKSSYEELIDKGTLLAVNEAANDVIEAVDGSEQRITDKIDELSKIINTLSSQSEIKSVADMKKFMQSKEMDMSKLHILFPEYGFKYENGEMYSRPLSPNAEKKYPPHFEGIAEISVGGTKVSVLDSTTINLSYRKQQPIEVCITDAVKMLGNTADPIQIEAEEIKGKIFNIPPKPFPEAFAVSMICDDVVLFDYIKIRTKEILDDNTFIVTNEEQTQAKFSFTLSINTEINSFTCSISSKSCDTESILSIDKFIICCMQHKKIMLKHLETGSPFIEGVVNIDSNESIEQIEDEIDFLERILILEKHFNTKFGCDKEFTEDDVSLINYCATLLNNGECTFNWTKLSIPMIVTEHTKVNLKSMNNNTNDITSISTVTFIILGEEYKLPISRTFKNVIVNDYEKVMKKMELMDKGDSTTIEFIPNNIEGVFIDRLYPGEIPSINELTK